MSSNDKTGAIYVRFSREDKAFSITSQIREATEYAALNNITVGHIIQDDDIPGTTLPNERPGMSELWHMLDRVSDIIAID